MYFQIGIQFWCSSFVSWFSSTIRWKWCFDGIASVECFKPSTWSRLWTISKIKIFFGGCKKRERNTNFNKSIFPEEKFFYFIDITIYCCVILLLYIDVTLESPNQLEWRVTNFSLSQLIKPYKYLYQKFSNFFIQAHISIEIVTLNAVLSLLRSSIYQSHLLLV